MNQGNDTGEQVPVVFFKAYIHFLTFDICWQIISYAIQMIKEWTNKHRYTEETQASIRA